MTRSLIPLLATGALLFPAAAVADHRPGHQGGPGQGGGGQGQGNATTISALDAKPATVVFGSATVLSGRLNGGTVRGVVVRLESDQTRPYGDAYRPVTGPTGAPVTATTDQNGRFSFTLKPQRNTQYRAVAQ